MATEDKVPLLDTHRLGDTCPIRATVELHGSHIFIRRCEGPHDNGHLAQCQHCAGGREEATCQHGRGEGVVSGPMCLQCLIRSLQELLKVFKEICGSPEFQRTRDNIQRQGPKALERAYLIFIDMSCVERSRCTVILVAPQFAH